MSIFGFPSLLEDAGQEDLLAGGNSVRLLLEGQPLLVSVSGLPFSDTFTGANGAGWDAAKWDNYVESNAAGSATIQANRGRLEAGGAGFQYSQISAITPTLTDFEITGQMIWDSTAEAQYSISFRNGDLTQAFRSTYSIIFDVLNNAIYLAKFTAGGTQTNIVVVSSAGINTVAERSFRLSVVGSIIQFKVWLTSGTEPIVPTIEATDSTLTSGKVSLSTYNGTAATNRYADWDNFAIQTSGYKTGYSFGYAEPVVGTNFQMGYGAGYGLKKRVFNFWGARQYFSTYREAVFRERPVGFWALDETSGVIANDLGSLNNDGTYTGTYTRGGRTIGGNSALDISGAGYVTIPDNNAYSPFWTGNITIELLLYSDTLATQTFMSKATASNFEWTLDSLSTGAFEFTLWTLAGAVSMICTTSTSVFIAGKPYHIAVTMNFDALPVIDLWVNGVLEASDMTSNSPPGDGTAPINIGRRGDNVGVIDGLVSCAAMYTTFLTPSAIKAHYGAARL